MGDDTNETQAKARVAAAMFALASACKSGTALLASYLSQCDKPQETWNEGLKELARRGDEEVVEFLSSNARISKRESLRKELMRFNEDQMMAYERAVLQRRNLFLTGPGGCGKTRVIGVIVEGFEYHNPSVNVVVSAMTAKIAAALHPLGKTFHKAIGMGLAQQSVEYYSVPLRDGSNRGMLRRLEKILCAIDVLIVDEISMCDPLLLEKFDAAAKRARRSHQPFGGIQVLFMGDFCQIPPVVRAEDRAKRLERHGRKEDMPPESREYKEAVQKLEDAHAKDPVRFGPAHETLCEEYGLPPSYAFEARCWREAFPSDGSNTVYLTKSYRQKEDGEFAKLLNRMRLGDMLVEDYEVLQSFVTTEALAVEEDGMCYAELEGGRRVPYLRMRAHRVDVDRINRESLAKVRNPVVRFPWEARYFSHAAFAAEAKKLSRTKFKLVDLEFDGCLKRFLQQVDEAPSYYEDKGPRKAVKFGPSGLTDAFARGEDSEADRLAEAMQLPSPLELKVGCGVYVTENTRGGRDGIEIANGEFGRVVGYARRFAEDEGWSVDPIQVYESMQIARHGTVQTCSRGVPFRVASKEEEDPTKRVDIEGDAGLWCPVVEFETTSLDSATEAQKKVRCVVPRKRYFANVPGRGWVVTYQFPLTLAGARTAHGSQGMTASAIEADLSKTFGFGMDYVMLSRLTKLDRGTLVLRGFKRNVSLCNPLVAAFYRHLERQMERQRKERRDNPERFKKNKKCEAAAPKRSAKKPKTFD